MNILQLFYRDPNNGLSSFWQNPDGIWSGEQHLGGFLTGDPIAAPPDWVSANVLQLFYQGTNNGPCSGSGGAQMMVPGPMSSNSGAP